VIRRVVFFLKKKGFRRDLRRQTAGWTGSVRRSGRGDVVEWTSGGYSGEGSGGGEVSGCLVWVWHGVLGFCCSVVGSQLVRWAWRRTTGSCGTALDRRIHGGGRVGLRFATLGGQQQSVRLWTDHYCTSVPVYHRGNMCLAA